MLHSGQVHPLHRSWAEFARERLRTLDTTLLQAITPPRRTLLTPPLDLGGPPTIEHQLKLVANWPPKLLRAELESVWQGLPMPDAARQVIAGGPAGARWVAAALAAYWEAVMAPDWEAVMAPDWEHMRAVIDAEIAYRARQLVLGGISAVLNDLHPRLQLDHATIRLNKTGQQNYDLAGNGVLLVPEIFAGPHLLFDLEALACRSSATPPAALAWSGRTTVPSHPALTCSVPLCEGPHRHLAPNTAPGNDHRPSLRAWPQRRHRQRPPGHPQTLRHGHLMAFRSPRPLPAHRPGL